jgi:hypothetical protein
MSHTFYHDLVSKLRPDEVIFVCPDWLREIKKTNRSAAEMSVLLAQMVNAFWIKDKTNHPTGVKKEWQTHVFVINNDLINKWCDVLKFSHPMIRDYLKGLAIAGFLKEMPLLSGEEVKAILCGKTPQRIAAYLTHQCEWCGCFTGYLHNHHYPIPRKQGGEETVSICPNCHSEFHYLVRLSRYKITQKVWDIALQYQGVEVEK